MLSLQNITATVNLGCTLDLVSIAERVSAAKYNPRRFAGLILRIKDPVKATALIFRNGKLVCVGTKSIESCERAAQKFVQLLKDLGFDAVKLLDFRLHNFVGSFDAGFRIDLTRLRQEKGSACFYEPEIFPGLHYYWGKNTVLIFLSGKVVITGCRNCTEVETVYANILPLLAMYKK